MRIQLSSQHIDTLTRDLKFCTTDYPRLLFLKDSHTEQVWICENLCPHRARPIDQGLWDGNTHELVCPFHGARFQIREEGRWISGAFSEPIRVLKSCTIQDLASGVNLDDFNII